MELPRIVCQFNCGAASAVATKLAQFRDIRPKAASEIVNPTK
ncbi:hypothetical protein ACIPIN_06490 [Pseudomonas sp. NPDC087697]